MLDQAFQPGAQNSGLGHVQNGTGNLVHVHDRALGVEHDQAVFDTFDNRRGLGALPIKLGQPFGRVGLPRQII